MSLNTELTPEGVRVTDSADNLVALIKPQVQRDGQLVYYVKMNGEYHGGIDRNWYNTLKGAEYAVLAAWYDAGNE